MWETSPWVVFCQALSTPVTGARARPHVRRVKNVFSGQCGIWSDRSGFMYFALTHLTCVHASFEDSGTKHPVGDVFAHQTLTHRAVDDPNLGLLQDGGGEA